MLCMPHTIFQGCRFQTVEFYSLYTTALLAFLRLFQLPPSSMQASLRICPPSVPCSDLSHSLWHLQFPLPGTYTRTVSLKLVL